MANVYTKKSRYPKTVTLRDFGAFYLTEFVRPRNPRCLSPTRGGNPHPSGLLYQDPYNRDNAWFGIWNPDPTKRNRKMSIMLPHIQRTNFTCGTYISPDTSSQRGPPNVKYSLASTHRSVFSKPRPCSGFLSHYTDVTRFAHTPRTAAIGIVPNSLPPVKGATSKPQSVSQEEETPETKTTMRSGSKTLQK